MEDAGNQSNQSGNQTSREHPQPENDMAKFNQRGPSHSNAGFKASQIVEYIFWVLAAIVLLRFAFKLIGANSNNAIVKLIFDLTAPVVNLFKGIIGDVTSGPMVIEFSSLISVLILWLIYKAVVKLITIAR